MQLKDIPEEPILARLAEAPTAWHTLYEKAEHWMPGDGTTCHTMRNLLTAFPSWVSPKMARAKMRSLIESGKCFGCACGCRGDYCLDQGF